MFKIKLFISNNLIKHFLKNWFKFRKGGRRIRRQRPIVDDKQQFIGCELKRSAKDRVLAQSLSRF